MHATQSQMDLFAHGGNLADIRERYALHGRALLDFSANINPLGMPDSVREAILSSLPSLAHYPDTECRRLRRGIAERHGVSPDNVIVGNGSTEMMFLVARALLHARACVIDPTFTEYRRAIANARQSCLSIVADAKEEFHIASDHLARAAQSAKMVFICNPNNPTGAVIRGEEIASVAARFPDVLFVVDEAFCDFLRNEQEVSLVQQAVKALNIIVLRSLTKFFAIPGLRLGYVVSHEKNIGQMLNFKEPWSVNSLAEAAGCAALQDAEFARRTRECVALWKEQLAGEMSRIQGLRVFPPSVNFILAKITRCDMNTETLRECLLKEAILIRNCANFPGLDPTYFRVAVRSPRENAMLTAALREALE